MSANLIPSAPNFAPTQLKELYKNATNVTISWTAVNASDADGYVVYSYKLPLSPDNASIENVGNVTEYTTEVQLPEYGYIFQVRAYQDLLGPADASLAVNSELSHVTYLHT